MAHTKALGSTKLGRDSAAQRLGLKKNHGQSVRVGQIIIRQRGSKYLAGEHVGHGNDDTLFSLREGTVAFYKKRKQLFDGSFRRVTGVKVVPR